MKQTVTEGGGTWLEGSDLMKHLNLVASPSSKKRSKGDKEVNLLSPYLPFSALTMDI